MRINKIQLDGFKRMKLNDYHSITIDFDSPIQQILGTNGSGKAQPLISKVKIPGGWSLMGDLKIGDYVISRDGSESRITHIFPQGQKMVYEVTFMDGRSTLATSDHLWKVYCAKSYPITPEVMSTEQINEQLKLSPRIASYVWVDLIESEQSPDIDLEVDPYVLGVILGDGCITTNYITISNPDEQIMLEVSKRLKNDLATNVRNVTCPLKCLTYSISNNPPKGPGSNYIIAYLKKEGLIGTRSHTKFIPEDYLKASTSQRLALLQGLLDTDGYIAKHSTVSFTTTSEKLSLQVQYLVRSLGGIARISEKKPRYNHNGVIKEGRLAYIVNIRYKKPSDLFLLDRKKERANDNNQYAASIRLKIKSITPHSFQECQCIRIDHPEHLYITDDFIVTHNSSLLSELNPLPGDHKDFDKGGKKHIWISHRGHEYECISDFSDGNKHTFIKDGIVLNELGNTKIQTELVEKEFNYNKKKRDLLLGRVKFTTMRPDQRREWFTHLSDVNYSYAIHVYMKMKERQRDITGSLREHKRRVVLESAKVLKDEEINKLKSDIKLLHDEITELLDRRETSEYSIESTYNDQSMILDKISIISKEIISRKIYQPVHVSNLDELNDKIQELKNQIIIKETTIDQLQKEASRIQKEANVLKQSGLCGIIEIDLKEVELAKLRDNKNSLISNDILFNDPIASMTGLQAVEEDLIDICIQLPINSDKSINQSYSTSLKDKLEINYTRRKEIQNVLNKKVAFKLHLEEHKAKDHIECPKCTHQWKLGYDESKYQKTLSDIRELEKNLEDIEKEAKELDEKIQYVNEYAQLFRRYRLISQSRPDLKPLFDYIEYNEILTNNPKSLQSLIDRVKNSLNIQCEIVDIDKELIKIKEIKRLAESSSIQSMNQVNERLDHYALEVNRVTKEKQYLDITLKDYNHYKNEIQFILDSSKALENLLDKKKDLDIQTVKAVVYDVITKEYKIRQSTLATKEDILSEVMNQKNIVLDLERQIDRLSIDQEALGILVDQISPKEGLIAEGLFGFMKHFISRWNRVIDKVWTYPLEILPCSIDNNDNVELDYKFPLVVSDTENTKDDVSLGSTGMQEIINLAFVLVAMQCMDMKDYPVMLDEFSNTFDETHRSLAVELIKNLLDNYSFSQLFIVSHYLTLHGALTNAQVCLLNDTNLSVSTVVNKHVTFK